MRGLTVHQLADAKGFSPDELAGFGVADGKGRDGEPAVEMTYCAADGAVVAVKKRLRLEEPGRFEWQKGKPTMPYGLDRLSALAKDAPLFLVEGESDAWTLWLNGYASLGIPGASTWKPAHASGLADRVVFVWQEPGPSGEKFAAAITRDLPDARVIQSAAAKDANALWQSVHRDRAAFAAALGELMGAARSPREEAEAARALEAEAARVASAGLLDDPDLLQHVERYIVESGYAGDTKAPLTAYTSLSSRCLRRPLNLGIVAASASGKNAAIDAALPLVPESAYVMVKASSPRALVYGDDSFEHRIVIVGEIDSIPMEDGPAASAVRSIAADSAMAYDVVERSEETGKWGVRHIVKPGPTGLITTSTKPLPEQLSTRMLTIGIPDTAEHTRRVLHAHAAAVNGTASNQTAERFVQAQRWLELSGARDIYIPFAHALADAVPADLIRMRRDYRQFLTAIEAITFLHQCQRGRDARGRVIATLADYGTARELLLEVFTAAATGGVTAAVREVVQVVDSIGDAPDGVTVATIAKRVRPAAHRTTVQRRIHSAVRLGYLVNRETRRGAPMKLSLGDPLPEERDTLPTVEQLEALLSIQPETTASVHQVPEDPISRAIETDAPPVQHPCIGASEADGPMQTDAEALHRSPTNNDGPFVAPDAPMQATPEGIDSGGEGAMLRALYDSGLAAWACSSCRGGRSWLRQDGVRICLGCHPPAGVAPMG